MEEKTNQTKQATELYYVAPRSVKIGDIFYLIRCDETQRFSSPCRVCNDEKKLTINGVTFDCPVCGGYRSREIIAEVQNFTVMRTRVFKIEQEISIEKWDYTPSDFLKFNLYRKRGLGYHGDGRNFTASFDSQHLIRKLNRLPALSVDCEKEEREIEHELSRGHETYIFDDYAIARNAADIFNRWSLDRLNKYNAEHGTNFAPAFKQANDPK